MPPAQVPRRAFLRGALGGAAAVSVAAAAGCSPSRVTPQAGPVPTDAVPDPIGSLVTRWDADPFARGSYSYLPPGATSADRVALAKPVHRGLAFAGEATSPTYPATIHGAYSSGIDALDRLQPTGHLLVVGAGVSGLAAARAAADAGLEVTVVEARDRLGGRLWTDRSLGSPVDLGASWIHGLRGNPIAELVDRQGIDTVVTDYGSITVYDEAGGRLPDESVTRLLADTHALVRQATIRGTGPSLGGAIDAILDEQQVDAATRRLLDFGVVGEIELEFAVDVDWLSRQRWSEGYAIRGDDVLFPGGYDAVPVWLADGIDVRLGTAVERVEHGPGGVVLRTADGELQGDAAIVTLPLGVLQAGTVGFAPGLPMAHRRAISRLGMGVLDKVALRFPEVFWDDSEFVGFIADERGAWPYWLNLAPVVGEPILVAFHGGTPARQVEALDDTAIVAEAMTVLRTIYG